ncbi:zinc finger protein 91 isoform X1 [Cololabis saira]|uniref:zinc finger protein 91 isoform X1 n=1 Tax=Cololabis saira TaxID=129043 RepID=UPI002AD5250A|nr:zinc finger protein 91 isoform X1 [Cololabis saira]
MEGGCSAASTDDNAANDPGISGQPPGEDLHVSTEDSDGVGVFCCQDCGEAFSEETAYLEHHYQHKQQYVHLDDHSNLLHGAQKDSETPYSCTLCSRSFVEMTELDLHLKNHGQISTKESDIVTSSVTKQHTYVCSDCGKSYAVIGHFLNHLRSHQKASKSVFNDLEHLKKKSFQCESCGRSYSRASALDAHRRYHEEKLIKSKNRSSGDVVQTGELVVEKKTSEIQREDNSEKLFKCLCGKAFSTLSRLKTHQRFSRKGQCSPEETKQKPKKACNEFYCSECNKAFSSHVALINHQRWHSNHSKDSAKKFPCEECGKAFMTLTFLYRHQRTVHSDETPAKSFLHQVCQLQKKAFECKDCGLKFSRASALHSHQLQHTDVFVETEKETQKQSSPLSSSIVSDTGEKESEPLEALTIERAHSESLLPTSAAVEESHVEETDEDMECYEPGDFNVQVISGSESEDEPIEDVNPDLELLCESDQEVRDDGDTLVSPSGFVSKPGIDLKIVQIDFEQTDEQCALVAKEVENIMAGERFVCPECYQEFPSLSSLQVHRTWHEVDERRQETPGQSATVYTCELCGYKASSYEAHYSHMQTHGDQTPSSDVLNETEGFEKKTWTCDECGKVFTCSSDLVSHQLHHSPKKQFQCPNCLMSYLHAASLYNHMKTCTEQKREHMSATKKEYNPKKTLLGPKIYHCEQCGKGFWSLGAYSHHKQNQVECTDLRLRKGVHGSADSLSGRQRSGIKVACSVCGRKFRHRGILALHMRKHENGNHKCELCDRSFRLFSSLLRHQVVHSDQLLPPPSKSFQHQVEQLQKNTYSCPDCGKLFSRAKALQFHMKSHGYETGHSPSSPRSTVTLEDLQCATCFSHFSNKASLRAHQKLCIKRDGQAAVKTEPLENGVCTQEPSGQLKLQTEFKKEVESGTHKLKNNGEGSKTSSNLDISLIKTSIKEDPGKGLFPCSECGRRFVTNSALGSHKRWHKERKFPGSFLNDDDLKSVSRKTDEGPFQCNKCGRQFFNHHVLQRHQIFNPQCETNIEPDSNTNVESGSKREQVSCPEYDETFEPSSSLFTHVENEHCKIVEAADRRQDEVLDIVQRHDDTNCKALSSPQKPKAHQCPVCFMTFAKVRGLRAHKWQAHSKSTASKEILPLSVKLEPTVSNCETNKTENQETQKNRAADSGGRKIKSDPPHMISVSSLDCKKLSSSAVTPLHYESGNPEAKHVSKVEIETAKAAANVPPPLSCPSEHTVKYLFKCDKCGKAFQTEEQLGAHKAKAKSRPFCCALCCHSFWTGNQLRQHLVWHDEVRCRLPNEVRFRLSAAMTSEPLNLDILTGDDAGKSFPAFTMDPPTLDLTSRSQSGHSCQYCGKAFLSPTALQKHKSQHCDRRQRDTPAAVSGYADGLTCLKCGTTFCQEYDLHQHYTEHACGV